MPRKGSRSKSVAQAQLAARRAAPPADGQRGYTWLHANKVPDLLIKIVDHVRQPRLLNSSNMTPTDWLESHPSLRPVRQRHRLLGARAIRSPAPPARRIVRRGGRIPPRGRRA